MSCTGYAGSLARSGPRLGAAFCGGGVVGVSGGIVLEKGWGRVSKG